MGGCYALRSHNEAIAVLGTKKQAFTPLADISVEMQQAIVAIEDSRFFLHRASTSKGSLALCGWT